MMNWPPVLHDLQYSHGSQYGPEEETAVLNALRAGSPGAGPHAQRFEREFSRYVSASFGLATSSGTAALELGMAAIGVRPGDEIITTPLTWISTASAAARFGARVVFADVDPRRYTIDPQAVESCITPQTKAIVAVHLYGQCADMDALASLASRHGLVLIEDCAHAPGATYRGRPAGSMGDLAIFSFGYQKNMTTLGEGGMLVTSSPNIAETALSRRWLCCRGYDPQGRFAQLDPAQFPMGNRYWHMEFDGIGTNARMTDAQGAVGLVQLAKLPALTARRRQIAHAYTAGLSGVPGLVTPWVAPECHHVFHVYSILVRPEFGLTKEDFMWTLWRDKGIKCLQHYMPAHQTAAFASTSGATANCPVASHLFTQYVSLPIHPRLTGEAVDYLIASVRQLRTATIA